MWRNAGGLGLLCVLLNYANGHITLTRLMVIYPPALAFYMLCHQRLLSTLIDKEIKGILFLSYPLGRSSYGRLFESRNEKSKRERKIN